MAFAVQTSDASAILLAKRADPSNGSFFNIGLSGGMPFVEIDGDANGTNYNYFTGSTAIDDGHWHAFVVVRQGPTVYLYIDGVLNTTSPSTGTTNISNNADLLAGTYLPTLNLPSFAGAMENISVFNQALSAPQIQTLATDITVVPAATSQFAWRPAHHFQGWSGCDHHCYRRGRLRQRHPALSRHGVLHQQ